MKRFLFPLFTALLAAGCVRLSPPSPRPQTLALWPALQAQLRPGEAQETACPDAGDNSRRITNIRNPTLTVFPAKARPDGKPSPAVLVCPGGGYQILAIDKEGMEIAAWLNRLGITGVVLKYRVPGNRAGAFQDAQRAMRLIRRHAKEWNIAPDQVGAIGFSAGAHLSARLSTDFAKCGYPAVDEADKLDCRPNFAILLYPAYLVKKDLVTLAEELPVSAKTTPTFLVQTQDDACHIECSLVYYQALQRAKVHGELHVFPVGGHGYGLRPSPLAVSAWPALCERWLAAIGVIPAS